MSIFNQFEYLMVLVLIVDLSKDFRLTGCCRCFSLPELPYETDLYFFGGCEVYSPQLQAARHHLEDLKASQVFYSQQFQSYKYKTSQRESPIQNPLSE